MDWSIQESPVRFVADTIGKLGTIHSFPEQKVLYRSDTKAALSVVSNRYQIVQPREVLEFYRDLTEISGYELETAGVLKGGRKFWALARTGQGTALKSNDQVNGYLLLATSCDGTLATTATPTTARVVCNNTLSIALDGAPQAIKVPHNTRFDPQLVKKQLDIAVSGWDEFMYRMKYLAERKIRPHEAKNFFLDVLCDQRPAGSDPERAGTQEGREPVWRRGSRGQLGICSGYSLGTAQCRHRVRRPRTARTQQRVPHGFGLVRSGCPAQAEGPGYRPAAGHLNPTSPFHIPGESARSASVGRAFLHLEERTMEQIQSHIPSAGWFNRRLCPPLLGAP